MYTKLLLLLYVCSGFQFIFGNNIHTPEQLIIRCEQAANPTSKGFITVVKSLISSTLIIEVAAFTLMQCNNSFITHIITGERDNTAFIVTAHSPNDAAH